MFFFRPSSLALSKAVKDGVAALSETCQDYGLLTTPQLHFIVSSFNAGEKNVSEESYYVNFSSAFKAFFDQVSIALKLISYAFFLFFVCIYVDFVTLTCS